MSLSLRVGGLNDPTQSKALASNTKDLGAIPHSPPHSPRNDRSQDRGHHEGHEVHEEKTGTVLPGIRYPEVDPPCLRALRGFLSVDWVGSPSWARAANCGGARITKESFARLDLGAAAASGAGIFLSLVG